MESIRYSGLTALALGAVDMAATMPMVYTGAAPTAPNGYRSRQRSHFDPRINRHTGKPHEHKREIARRMVKEGNRLFRTDLRAQRSA